MTEAWPRRKAVVDLDEWWPCDLCRESHHVFRGNGGKATLRPRAYCISLRMIVYSSMALRDGHGAGCRPVNGDPRGHGGDPG